MKKWVYILLAIAVAFPSCKSPSWQKKMENLIGRTVNIPKHISAYKGGELQVPSLPDTLMKYGGGIFYYFGKEECQLCIVSKIPLWTDHLVKDFPDIPIVFLFSNELLIDDMITCSKLAPNALLIFDHDDAFLKLNRFVPTESFLRMYALDSKGKILLCGNLVGNDDLKQLFMEFIY